MNQSKTASAKGHLTKKFLRKCPTDKAGHNKTWSPWHREVYPRIYFILTFFILFYFLVCVCGVCLYKHLVSVGVLTMLEDGIEPLEMG